MDLRQLRTFEAVARTGSFTAAAAELAYTQSAVSQHIAALEAVLGQPLLTRRPVALTPAGARLATHARHVLLRLDVARTELAGPAPGSSALTLAVSPTGFTDGVTGLLHRVWVRSPASALTVRTLAQEECLRQVADGRADAVVLDGITTANQPFAVTEPGVLVRHLIAEHPLLVLLPAGHPLAGCAGLDLAALQDAHWVDAAQLRSGPGAVPGLAPVAASHRLRYDGYDVAALLRLVAHRLGLALLSQGLVVHHPDVVAVPLREPALFHRLELVHLPGRAAAAQPLVDALAS